MPDSAVTESEEPVSSSRDPKGTGLRTVGTLPTFKELIVRAASVWMQPLTDVPVQTPPPLEVTSRFVWTADVDDPSLRTSNPVIVGMPSHARFRVAVVAPAPPVV